MSNFTDLPIVPGQVGMYHMNRFRICVQGPTAAEQAHFTRVGAQLLGHMPDYMHPHTAQVAPGPFSWNGLPTLRFIGVARIKPFSVPVFVPVLGQVYKIPVPEQIRDWMAPDIHPDVVGVVASTPTSFTAQTLKRNYTETSDNLIRAAAKLLLRTIDWNPAIGLSADLIEPAITDYVIWLNQHHFLAGRRSFRFDSGASFGYTDGRYVFETAAMERFSHVAYEKSQALLGDAASMVRPVWVEMIQRFCTYHGLRVVPDTSKGGHWKTDPGGVSYLQQGFHSYNAMLGSQEGLDIASKHAAIHP